MYGVAYFSGPHLQGDPLLNTIFPRWKMEGGVKEGGSPHVFHALSWLGWGPSPKDIDKIRVKMYSMMEFRSLFWVGGWFFRM